MHPGLSNFYPGYSVSVMSARTSSLFNTVILRRVFGYMSPVAFHIYHPSSQHISIYLWCLFPCTRPYTPGGQEPIRSCPWLYPQHFESVWSTVDTGYIFVEAMKERVLIKTLTLKCSTWMCYLLSTKWTNRRPSVFSVPFLYPIELVIDIWSSRISIVSRNSGRWTTCLGSLFLPLTIRTVLFSLAWRSLRLCVLRETV